MQLAGLSNALKHPYSKKKYEIQQACVNDEMACMLSYQ